MGFEQGIHFGTDQTIVGGNKLEISGSQLSLDQLYALIPKDDRYESLPREQAEEKLRRILTNDDDEPVEDEEGKMHDLYQEKMDYLHNPRFLANLIGRELYTQAKYLEEDNVEKRTELLTFLRFIVSVLKGVDPVDAFAIDRRAGSDLSHYVNQLIPNTEDYDRVFLIANGARDQLDVLKSNDMARVDEYYESRKRRLPDTKDTREAERQRITDECAKNAPIIDKIITAIESEIGQSIN